MSFEPLGLITVLAGLACFALGPAVSIVVFSCFTLLGAAAAAVLPALGGANIQPSHVLLMFLFGDLILRPALMRRGLTCFRYPAPGFWLLLTSGYGTLVTAIMPRLFAGETYVFSPARSDSGISLILLIPLAPSGANITQSLYFISDVICFFVAYSYASGKDAVRNVIKAGIVCAGLNLVFAAVDLITYYTNTAYLLTPIRNSSYRLLDDVETSGLKRIVGSFTEAGAFAYTTLGLLMFTLRLWSEGIMPWRTGIISFLSVVALLFATSSTGYVGLAVVLAVQLPSALWRFLSGRATWNTLALLAIAPVVCGLLVTGVLLTPALRASVGDLVESALFNKLSSDSGIERGAWNRQAFTVIWDTMWLGAGIGSLRASSWLVVVPASIGALGMAFYLAFIAVVLGAKNRGDHAMRATRAAARNACVVQLVAASISGAFIDLGLFFFLFAGIASGLRPSPRSDLAPSASPPVGATGRSGRPMRPVGAAPVNPGSAPGVLARSAERLASVLPGPSGPISVLRS